MPNVVSREEWLAARKKLLAENELTHRSDELAGQREELSWIRVDKTITSRPDGGSASLADLFQGNS